MMQGDPAGWQLAKRGANALAKILVQANWPGATGVAVRSGTFIAASLSLSVI